jgi:hypothetical protein
MKTHLLTSKIQNVLVCTILREMERMEKKPIFSSPEFILRTPTISVDRLNREILSRLFSTPWVLKIRTMLIYQTKNPYVTDCSRVS